MSFPKMKLGECAEIHSGSTPRTNNPDFWDGDITWVTPKDLSKLKSKFISKTESKITQLGFDSCSTKLLPENSVLFSSRAPIGHVAINTIPICTNQGFKSFVPKADLLDSQYLYYWLKANKEYLQDLGVGATFKEISKTVIANVEIPLPPLAEQRRIAAILDQADELRQKRQQAIEKLDQLLQATFIDMFGDPVSNPKGWDKVKFENEVEFLTGFAFKSADFKDSGIMLCRGINILPNTLDWNDTAYWNIEELEKYARFKILQNDILVAMDRPWISTGFKITLVKENDPNMLLVQRVARLRVKESFGANFLFQILSMPEFKKHCRITETTVPHISPTDFKSFELIKPDNHLIEKFEKIAKLIHSQKAKMWNSSLEYKNLFDSLQNQAFNGTL